MAGGDESDLRYLRRYTEPSNIYKALKSLRSKMDSGELKAPMPDAKDEKALKAWRESNGVPETPEGYIGGLKERGIEITEGDEPLFAKYFQDMHEIGATPEQVLKGVNAFFEQRQLQDEMTAEADTQFKRDSEDRLRADWGAEYRANLNHMKNTLSPLMPDGLWDNLQEARMPDGRKFADHPEMMKFLVAASRQIADIGTIVGDTPHKQMESINAEIAKIEEKIKDSRSDYWTDQKMQDRYNQLLQAQERLASR